MIKCEIDEKEFNNGGVFAKYLKRQYGLTYQQYYHKYVIKTDAIPKCSCGCAEELNWTNVGYKKYKGNHGLLLRLKNNNPWGHNKNAIEKSAETRRRQYANGERFGWCKGLSINTDERIKKLAEKTKKTINSNPIELKRRSDLMKTHRKDGTIPTLYREQSSQWKGGVSSIQLIARNDKRLYDKWKYPILARDGFKCVKCLNTKDLHVHHDKETFSEIIKKVMTIDDYDHIDDFETKKLITKKVINYHVNTQVSGVTVCKTCHNDIHPSLNF
jgi:hypothetical protein